VRKRPSTGNFRFHLVATNGHVIATSLATVLQAALTPVTSSVGTDFKPAARAPLDTMVHWGRWEADPAATRTCLPGRCALLSEVAGNAPGSLSSARRTRPGRGE
jgi:hypothetical protein